MVVHVKAIVVQTEDVVVFAWPFGVPRQVTVETRLLQQHFRKQSELSFYIA